MSEINVKTLILDESISKMTNLLEKSSNNPLTNIVVSKGFVADEMSEILSMVMSMDESIDKLITNTIGFMKNVKSTYIGADNTSADIFKE